MSSITRALRELKPVAESLGFQLIGLTRNSHIKWRHRTGVLVITCSHINTDRHLANAMSELRKGARRAETQA